MSEVKHVKVRAPKPARYPAYTIESGAGETLASFPILASGDTSKLADIAAEAFNVAHETGLTPRQIHEKLADMSVAFLAADNQRAELLAALKRLSRAVTPLVGDDSEPDLEAAWDVARAAIAKVEGDA